MPKVSALNRCQHISPSGRQCRMPHAADLLWCTHHARQQDSKAQLALDLLPPIPGFYSGLSINYVIGRVLVLLASDRVSPRKAAVLAYTCQLLLQSLRDVKSELGGEISPELHNTYHALLKGFPPQVVAAYHAANSESAPLRSSTSSPNPVPDAAPIPPGPAHATA